MKCWVDIGRTQLDAGAEIGRHRALGIGGDENQMQLPGCGTVRRRRGGEGDARGLDIAAEHGARRIVTHLADIAGEPAEPRRAHHGVGGGATADLDRSAHARAECLGTLGVDQGHRALVEAFFGEQRVRSASATASTMALPIPTTSS